MMCPSYFDWGRDAERRKVFPRHNPQSSVSSAHYFSYRRGEEKVAPAGVGFRVQIPPPPVAHETLPKKKEKKVLRNNKWDLKYGKPNCVCCFGNKHI